MESQMLFNIAVSIAGGLGGWILNNIYRAIERLDADVRSMPNRYVIREDYRSDIAEIKDGLNRIYERLDHKADK